MRKGEPVEAQGVEGGGVVAGRGEGDVPGESETGEVDLVAKSVTGGVNPVAESVTD